MKPSDSVSNSTPESTVSPQSNGATASTPQPAPATGEPGSGSNNEAVGRLNCQTLRTLGVNSQSVSTIVDGTMQVNPGMSKDAAKEDLVQSVHLYCPQFDDELQQANSN
jgi:hypothetical protein